MARKGSSTQPRIEATTKRTMFRASFMVEILAKLWRGFYPSFLADGCSGLEIRVVGSISFGGGGGTAFTQGHKTTFDVG